MILSSQGRNIIEDLTLNPLASHAYGPWSHQQVHGKHLEGVLPLIGPQHQRLVRGIAPKHRGVLVGTVCAVQSATASFALKLAPGAVNVPLRPGTGGCREIAKYLAKYCVLRDFRKFCPLLQNIENMVVIECH